MIPPARLLLRCLPVYFAAFCAGILLCAVIHTVLVPAPTRPAACTESDEEYISDAKRNLSGRLAHALTIPTITRGAHDYDAEPLLQFHRFIKTSFPHIHSSPWVTAEVVANYSLLYVVHGSDPNLTPYLLCGHLDVVPVAAENWLRPPFGGEINDGEIWGRGAIDAKHIVMGIMEALEFLLERGHRPKRTIYVAFGHDEEGNGLEGAFHIGKLLVSRGVHFEYILDEGTMIVNESFPGVAVPVALVGVSEKGYLTFKLTARGTSIHTAVPPRETSILTLSRALLRFHSQAHPNLFGKGVEVKMLEIIGSHAPFWMKFFLVNSWLFGPLISRIMSMSGSMDSLIRTITAATIVHGGVKENIAPGEVHALINQRIHPFNSVAEVMEYNKYLVRDLTNVTLEVVTSLEPHPVSPHDDDTFGYQMITNSIHKIFPSAAVAPALCMGSTDTKHYLKLSKAIYRFSPANITPKQAHRFHGDNERISTLNYEKVVNFYKLLILSSDSTGIRERTTSRKSGDL